MSKKYDDIYKMSDGASSPVNANLFNSRWKDLDDRLDALESGTLLNWTSATRPTPESGKYYAGFNTDTQQFELWNGTDWVIVG